jgi:8-oxo-dGTP pyrophosphatase MutT (NUDIX family)
VTSPPAALPVRHRRAGRVIPVHGNAVLLLHGSDPARPHDGRWWFTVGGGCEEGETTADAARREAFEEAGLVLTGDLGPVVLHRTAEFDFEGVHYVQTEDFYAVPVDSDAVDTSRWTDLERRSVSGYRWWPLAELATTAETVHPDQLLSLVHDQIALRGLS